MRDLPSDLRGWHAAGQTWLVWTDPAGVGEAAGGYEIYRSRAPIAGLDGAERIGRVLPQDWRAQRLRDVFKQEDVTWRISDGHGGCVSLGPEEALFVHTPHEAVAEWFAVVPCGDRRIGPGNVTGPILQTVEPVEAHLQSTWEDAEGYRAHHYAHWIDGLAPWSRPRPDYPIMGNPDFHGTAQIFAVWEPVGSAAPEAPAVFCLHWRKGHYNQWRPAGRLGLDLRLDGVGGLLVSIDDHIWVIGAEGQPVSEHTRWAGMTEGFERFNSRRSPPGPESGRFVLYTCARVEWVRRQVVAIHGADPRRCSVVGYSMGSAGAHLQVLYCPESWAASAHFEGPVEALEADRFEGEIACVMTGGDAELPTNLPDGFYGQGPSSWFRLYRPDWRCQGPDLPPAWYLWGINDRAVPWDEEKHRAIARLDERRRGARVFWDERNHRIEGWREPPFEGAPTPRWSTAPEVSGVAALTLHRADRSFPAFSREVHPDADLQAPSGTRGGCFGWDAATLVDEDGRWEVTLFLNEPLGGPAFENAVADVTVRRAQRFRPPPGTPLRWEVRREVSGELLAEGRIEVADYGEVTVPGVRVERGKRRLIAETEPPTAEKVTRFAET